MGRRTTARQRPDDKPEILDDPRLEPATQWLRKLDWFTPEPGLWIGDANENFLGSLAERVGGAPAGSGISRQRRRFTGCSSRRASSSRNSIVKGSGIDWLAVSAEWEAEGLKLSKADLERLAAATSRFVKLPNSGWVELDTAAVQGAHEAMADMGVDGLIAVPQKVGLEHVAHLDEDGFAALRRFAGGEGVARTRPRFQRRSVRRLAENVAGRIASVSKGRLRFSRASRADQARRHSGRRHGPRQNAADADVAGVAQGTQHEKSQAVARDLSRRPCCTTGGARRNNSRRT